MEDPCFASIRHNMKLTEIEPNVMTSKCSIKSMDTDCFYSAKPTYYFGLNQEMGGLHATEKGVGVEALYNREHKTWMIIRTRMHISKLAHWPEDISLITWPQEGYRLYCPRAVKAYDEKGDELFNAENWWVIMDLERKRPCKPEYIMSSLPPADKAKHYFDPAFPQFPKEEEYEGERLEPWRVKINYYDTDYNRHVNNISYVNWILDALPKEFLDSYMPTLLDVKWLHQCFLTDDITVFTYSDAGFSNETPSLYSKIMRGDEVVFEATSEWKRRINNEVASC